MGIAAAAAEKQPELEVVDYHIDPDVEPDADPDLDHHSQPQHPDTLSEDHEAENQVVQSESKDEESVGK